MSDKHPATPCCNYECPKTLPYPIFWNEFNGFIKCHNCGNLYHPMPVLNEERLRHAFEGWITSPPYEMKATKNQPEDPGWPGHYMNLTMQLAWEAWLESAKRLTPNPRYINPPKNP